MAEQGGDRLEQLARDIREQETERDRRRQRAERHATLLIAANEEPVRGEADFVSKTERIRQRREQSGQHEADLQNRITEWSVSLREGRREHEQLAAEIASLKARRSNIPSQQIALRPRCARLPASMKTRCRSQAS